MKRHSLSRRSVLRGAGGVAIGLPLLEIMHEPRRAHAQLQSPKRLLVFFSPNGSIHENWQPTGGVTDFELSPILAPLEEHKSDLVILDGINKTSAANGPGDDHMRGMGGMLTGRELLTGDTLGGAGEPSGLASGISVDQAIAAKIGETTKFKSLELGCLTGMDDFDGTVWIYTAYAAADTPLPPDNNPASVFQRVFGDVGADVATLERRLARRRSVLDAVQDAYVSLTPKLGRVDQQRLEAHLEEIRALELRLGTNSAALENCTQPEAPVIDFRANDNYPQIGRLQMDLLVNAFACDLTRVGTMEFNRSVGNVRFTWLGIDRGHHSISHDGDNPESIGMLTDINNWYAQQFAYLIGRLKAVPEGDGTLLDNTLIVWVNELARGNIHSHPQMPYVWAGRAGGTVKTGRYLRLPEGVTNNDMLVSMLNAFDIEDQVFGDPKYTNGPLPGVVG